MRAEKRRTPRKTFQSRVENQHTPRTDDVKTGIEPRPHWWHAIALTAEPLLIELIPYFCIGTNFKLLRPRLAFDVGVCRALCLCSFGHILSFVVL